MLDHADRTAPTRKHELGHTDLPHKDLDHPVGIEDPFDVRNALVLAVVSLGYACAPLDRCVCCLHMKTHALGRGAPIIAFLPARVLGLRSSIPHHEKET